MNEKEKFEQEFAEDGSFKVQGTPNDVWKWIEQHDQRILREFAEYIDDLILFKHSKCPLVAKQIEKFIGEKE